MTTCHHLPPLGLLGPAHELKARATGYLRSSRWSPPTERTEGLAPVRARARHPGCLNWIYMIFGGAGEGGGALWMEAEALGEGVVQLMRGRRTRRGRAGFHWRETLLALLLGVPVANRVVDWEEPVVTTPRRPRGLFESIHA